MMTIDQKVEAYRMRLEGATLKSIAEKFGVSLEWIRKIVPPIEGKTWSLYDMCNRCAYPGLGQWLFENRCTYAKLAEMIGAPDASVSRWMNGVHKMNKPTIDKILEVTGMTYEQAFGGVVKAKTEIAETARDTE